MKVTAVTRFKHGGLLTALRQANLTGSELARRIKKSPNCISELLNLKARPSEDLANRIQRVLAETGVVIDVLEFWPEDFRPLKRSVVVEETQEIEVDKLQYAQYLQLADKGRDAMDEELRRRLEKAIGELDPRGQAMLKMHYFEGKSCEEIASLLTRSSKSVQIYLSDLKRQLWRSPIFDEIRGCPSFPSYTQRMRAEEIETELEEELEAQSL
jgi:RNA polymerase sigma factor (sigma-70 family)